MPNRKRIILIGGTSHTGKSSVASELAKRLGVIHVSTDLFARHPGRPWSTPERTIPDHVPIYYREHTVEELIKDVLKHYRSLWPQTENLIVKHSNPAEPTLILEGSALLPELVAKASKEGTNPYWLTASSQLIKDRIFKSSNIESAMPQEREAITKFIDRALAFESHLAMTLSDHQLVSCEVKFGESISDLADRIEAMSK